MCFTLLVIPIMYLLEIHLLDLTYRQYFSKSITELSIDTIINSESMNCMC